MSTFAIPNEKNASSKVKMVPQLSWQSKGLKILVSLVRFPVAPRKTSIEAILLRFFLFLVTVFVSSTVVTTSVSSTMVTVSVSVMVQKTDHLQKYVFQCVDTDLVPSVIGYDVQGYPCPGLPRFRVYMVSIPVTISDAQFPESFCIPVAKRDS